MSGSLPVSSSKRQKRSHPPAGVQQAFKAAAFSVTQLYKAAAAEEDAARAAGYQDAIAELVTFLDDENLGVGDGEGWRIRQWAHERLTPDTIGSDSDVDDDAEPEPQATPQPTAEAGTSLTIRTSPEHERNTTDTSSVPQTPAGATTTQSAQLPQPIPQEPRSNQADMFRFTANPQSGDTDMNSLSPPTSMQPPSSIRLNVRTSRSPKRRRQSREPSQSVHLGQGAGLKRKTSSNFDWIDFAGLGRDWHGHGGGASGGMGAKKSRRGD